MTPKQYLVFILSGLCADVIKGERRMQTGVVAALSVKMIWRHTSHACLKVWLQKKKKKERKRRGIPVRIMLACAAVLATDRFYPAV